MSEEPKIDSASRAIKQGELTPCELVDHCLGRITQFEDRIHAWVLVDEDGARQQAQSLTAEARRGELRGPLHGIPIGIKDIVDVRGMPTRAGSPLTSEEPEAEDAPVVARLRKAGAIILGKTVTTQFACFDPPPTRNPWKLDRTPGGSSSGSAVAVALGMCLGAVGSQTGGSITRPASYCGVAGLKPTFGAISMNGVVPVSRRLDHLGPIARDTSGLREMLEVMLDRPQAFEGAFRLERAPRTGVLAAQFDEVLGSGAISRDSRDSQRALQYAMELMSEAGSASVIQRVELPASFDEARLMHRRIMAAEAAAYHRERFASHRDQYAPRVAGLIEEGLAVTPAQFNEAVTHQARFREEIFDVFGDADALVSPATTSVAPDRTTTGDPRFNSPWSYSGLPTVSAPCGVSEHGLPVALQFIGRPNEEARLLAVATWAERLFDFHALPPILKTSSTQPNT